MLCSETLDAQIFRLNGVIRMNSVDRSPKQRRCILFVIDALSKKILDRWLRSGRLPNMARVIEDGGKMLPCVSIFPSITPAATCSIATGAYPAQNGIEGACWFDPEKNDAAYYGDDVRFALKEGFHDYLVDFGDRLNFERLDAP